MPRQFWGIPKSESHVVTLKLHAAFFSPIRFFFKACVCRCGCIFFILLLFPCSVRLSMTLRYGNINPFTSPISSCVYYFRRLPLKFIKHQWFFLLLFYLYSVSSSLFLSLLLTPAFVAFITFFVPHRRFHRSHSHAAKIFLLLFNFFILSSLVFTSDRYTSLKMCFISFRFFPSKSQSFRWKLRVIWN